MNYYEVFLSITLAGFVVGCSGCGGCNKTSVADSTFSSVGETAKIDPQHQREVDKLRTGSEKERGAAAEELRKAGPAAGATAAALCELTTKPEHRIAALLALETVAPKLFGPVRTLTTADDSTAEIRAAGELGALGVEGRPAAVVLRWHLAQASARTSKKSPDAGRIMADLETLVSFAPHDPDVLKSLKTYLNFNADDNGYTYPTESLHESVVAHLAGIARVVPERRAEVAKILVPLLEDKLLRLPAMKALPACAQEGVRGRAMLNKLRFDPAPDVQKEADTTLAEIGAAEKAAAKITDTSPMALATQAMAGADRWVQQLAREKLGETHPALEEQARQMTEPSSISRHPDMIANDGLKQPPVHTDIFVHMVLTRLNHLEKEGPVVARESFAQVLLWGAPKAEGTRVALLAWSTATSTAVFDKTRTVMEHEVLWFGDELAANFPDDPAVAKLLFDASKPVVGDIDKDVRFNELTYEFSNRVVRSLGRLAEAQPKARKEVAVQLAAIMNGRRFGSSGIGTAAFLSGVDPDVLADALLACREEALPFIGSYINQDFRDIRTNDGNLNQFILRIQAKQPKDGAK